MLIDTRDVDDLKVHLVTNEEEDKLPDLIDKLDDIKNDMIGYGIEFDYNFREFHDRCIKEMCIRDSRNVESELFSGRAELLHDVLSYFLDYNIKSSDKTEGEIKNEIKVKRDSFQLETQKNIDSLIERIKDGKNEIIKYANKTGALYNAVSYTHLDVYKRQAYCSLFCDVEDVQNTF